MKPFVFIIDEQWYAISNNIVCNKKWIVYRTKILTYTCKFF